MHIKAKVVIEHETMENVVEMLAKARTEQDGMARDAGVGLAGPKYSTNRPIDSRARCFTWAAKAIFASGSMAP